jgi:hypothetical protein
MRVFFSYPDSNEGDEAVREMDSLPRVGDWVTVGGINGVVREVWFMEDIDEEPEATRRVVAEVTVSLPPRAVTHKPPLTVNEWHPGIGGIRRENDHQS